MDKNWLILIKYELIFFKSLYNDKTKAKAARSSARGLKTLRIWLENSTGSLESQTERAVGATHLFLRIHPKS